jgi:hypothetical protein
MAATEVIHFSFWPQLSSVVPFRNCILPEPNARFPSFHKSMCEMHAPASAFESFSLGQRIEGLMTVFGANGQWSGILDRRPS